MENFFLYLVWFIYIVSLLIKPISVNLSDILIGIVIIFSIIYIPRSINLNKIFINKYLFRDLLPLVILIILSFSYFQFRISFYLIFSILICWMGFLVGSKTNNLPINNIFYPIIICLISFLSLDLIDNYNFSSITCIFLLVPWLLETKNFFLFWIFNGLISLFTFSRAIIIGQFFSFSIFNSNRKIALILTTLGALTLILIFLNLDKISIFWNAYLKEYTLTSKPMGNSREFVWEKIISNLNPGTLLFGQSEFITYKDYSAHNGFLQAYIKLGLPGLLLLTSIPLLIIKRYVRNSSINSRVLVLMTFLYFVREIFEVTVIENMFYFVGLYWFVVGTLLRKIDNESKNID